MENAAEALKMAAAVLIFVVALSISINAFSEVRTTATTILNYKDNEYDYTYVQSNGGTERLVGLESIIPTIYKAYKENYKIVFDSNLLPDGVYQRKNIDTGAYEKVQSIDLQKEVLGNNTDKEQFIMGILYGSKYYNTTVNGMTIKDKFKKNFGIDLNTNGIYDKIQNRKVKECIGIYYQEEVEKSSDAGSDTGTTTDSSVPDANKTEKRVITYTSI